jgi:hypothetical protein
MKKGLKEMTLYILNKMPSPDIDKRKEYNRLYYLRKKEEKLLPEKDVKPIKTEKIVKIKMTDEERKVRNSRYAKEYREREKEKLKEYAKKYVLKNKDKMNEYRENNKEKILAKQKEYRENNKEKRICEHNIEKKGCKVCKGSCICPHNRIKSSCKECGGGSICLHNYVRTICKECGGGSICIHNKKRTLCIECGGGSICNHGKSRNACVECGGGSICPHKRLKSKCIECGGGSICPHGKQKSRCKECDGCSICIHKKGYGECKVCDIHKYLIKLQRLRIGQIMKLANITKTKSSIQYLDCSVEYFKTYIEKKMTPGMTIENIHYDHIKPVNKFNLQDPIEFMKCCHYTNFQPLLKFDNLSKADKWTDADELFWNENIIHKEYLLIYLPK